MPVYLHSLSAWRKVNNILREYLNELISFFIYIAKKHDYDFEMAVVKV